MPRPRPQRGRGGGEVGREGGRGGGREGGREGRERWEGGERDNTERNRE